MRGFAVGLCVGVAAGALGGWWALRGASPRPDVVPREPARAPRADDDALAARLGEKMDQLARRVDDLVAAARRESPPRSPAASTTPEKTSTPEVLDERLAKVEQQLAALAHAIEAHRHVATYPKAEQLRAARKDVDWALIAQVSDALKREREAGLALVRYLTFEEVLERFGQPTTINPEGSWFWERREGQTLGPEAFSLDFVDGYVVGVHSTDE